MDTLKEKIIIENPKGSYKSFEIEDDPISKSYPLKGITYPVDYGYIDGYLGEDDAELDVFVGTGNLNGYIKVWRLDVKEETKFFIKLTNEDLSEVLAAFKTVLLKHEILNDEEFASKIKEFRNKDYKLYRYTSEDEGIFSIGKRLLPENLIDEAWEARKWMPKPKLPDGDYRFYLTEKGKYQYENTLLKVHKKYLKDIKCEEFDQELIKEIVYKDEWQCVVKK